MNNSQLQATITNLAANNTALIKEIEGYEAHLAALREQIAKINALEEENASLRTELAKGAEGVR